MFLITQVDLIIYRPSSLRICIINFYVKYTKNSKTECILIIIMLKNSIKSEKPNSFSNIYLNIIEINHPQLHLS